MHSTAWTLKKAIQPKSLSLENVDVSSKNKRFHAQYSKNDTMNAKVWENRKMHCENMLDIKASYETMKRAVFGG